jgi:O-antigen/teichoic acid export membrane protein
MTASAPSTMRRDIASAYLAAATKIGSWVVVSALVYRWSGAAAFAMVSLVRATLSILNYSTFGLSPAIMNLLAQARRPGVVRTTTWPEGRTLDYASVRTDSRFSPIQVIFFNGMALGACGFALAALIVVIYGKNFAWIHRIPNAYFPSDFIEFVITFGLGVALRLSSDVPGAILQTHHRIAVDNLLCATADVMWVIFASIGLRFHAVSSIGWGYIASAALLFLGRLGMAAWQIGLARRRPALVWNVMRELLLFGGGVTVAQLADYLYAPIDFVLINRLLDPVLAAVYSPAVQIDAGLLLLVGGVASVLLPKTALAHASGNVVLIRKYYLRGTVVSGGLLALAAVCVWALSPWIFRLWLRDPMTATQVILPLVLIHTVVGGSSAVGRSVLLGMGKVRPFTIAVLSAGLANVVLSYCFVRYFGLGLKGIILGTIVVVVARCAIWQPWYVLRTLRRAGASPMASRPESAQTTC